MTETEIKLRVANVSAMRRRLRTLGWRVSERRHYEMNLVYDRRNPPWLAAGYLLRIREVGNRVWLTVKLPMEPGRLHKVREEYEIETRDRGVVSSIVETMGFKPVWRYEKYRTEFQRPREKGPDKGPEKGKILLDETPVGDLLELEGPPAWIDRTAAKLGFSKDDYITLSYRGLFVEYRRRHPEAGDDMVFDSNADGP